MDPFDLRLWAFAVGAILALFFYIKLIRERRSVRDSLAELARLKTELHQIKTAPQTWEFRVERFEVLWFPTITTSPISRQVTQVLPGAPHCPACIKPLTVSRKNNEWVCLECDSKYSASLDDISVIDAVTKLTLQYFKQRHPEYHR